ncbi:hypothetical protein D3Z36_06860 [Lachnospiraceae bacterium]|nr:hypothetical protein [Lachnospiraceae bacterium]
MFRKGFAFFPQASYKAIGSMRECEHLFVVNTDNHDKVILQKTREGLTAEEIFSREEILHETDKMFNVIEKMDESCDVKIASWMRAHYREQMIFTDPGHLSGTVYAEYIRQILPLVGIKEVTGEDIRKLCSKCLTLSMPVYGCVRDALQLRWTDEANRQIKKETWTLEGESLDISEYVKQYRYICVNNKQV